MTLREHIAAIEAAVDATFDDESCAIPASIVWGLKDIYDHLNTIGEHLPKEDQ